MVTSEPNIDKKGRYSLTQTASILGVHRNTISNYILSGALPVHYRKPARGVKLMPIILGIDILKLWEMQI